MKLAAYRKIAEPMNVELKAVFAKFGFDTRRLSAKIDESLGIVRMTIELGDTNHTDASGEKVSPDAAFYLEHCKLWGSSSELKAEWLNKECRMGGENFRLVGMKRAGKNCMLILRLRDNSLRVTSIEQVALFFGRAGIHPGENVGSTTDQGRGRPLGELLNEGK